MMVEKEITITSTGASLSGTLCLPSEEGTFPAVLMIHGSGPLDRNENMKGQSLNIFNQFAYSLAKSGIASLRYDKRGCGSSTGDFFSAGHEDFIVDAQACFDALIGIEKVAAEKIFLLGHSEGCIIAPQVCLRRQSAAGMVLVCPVIEPLESVLLRQAAQLEKELNEFSGTGGLMYKLVSRFSGGALTAQRRVIRKVKASSSSVIRVGFHRFPAKWLRELMNLDPQVVFKANSHPMLLIGGEKDLQCRPDDVYRIEKVTHGVAEARVLENLTHVLRLDERPAAITGQPQLLNMPVEQAVLDLVNGWIGSRIGNSSKQETT